MQAIGSIVGMQRICLAIEVVYLRVFDTVGCAANGFAKVGCIMRFVEFGFWECQDDVLTINVEFLDKGTLGEEGKS